ncbi:MAG: metal-sulfur cluster assembly factor [Ignavibacteriaceae bacterium]|jgi:Predicted metal-sulfur cluster biosynthetic enzyme|nr:MAG: metal-sulfur cluster biosynthetic enzyme [Chlorobi bacterium OLB4]MBW7856588.1 metal-sulfur cluster assembly factor [Ignavibacteria bacterium]MEB2329879.1 metal-sulfur cluster assembly factor [Ignavibacteriaceae bacterium]OQY77507.1 MAG: hypothetical protein B6D43_06295 [Ignavibacteriales bacterium UTCHB1]
MNKILTPKEEELLKALKDVIDPELMVNIVDLGLVYDLTIDEEKKTVNIDLTLTSPGCPLGDMITEDTRQMTDSVLPGYEIDIKLVWNPPWSFEMMTEDGRNALYRR